MVLYIDGSAAAICGFVHRPQDAGCVGRSALHLTESRIELTFGVGCVKLGPTVADLFPQFASIPNDERTVSREAAYR